MLKVSFWGRLLLSSTTWGVWFRPFFLVDAVVSALVDDYLWCLMAITTNAKS